VQRRAHGERRLCRRPHLDLRCLTDFRDLLRLIGGPPGFMSRFAGPLPRKSPGANFPALLLALTWRRFNTAGAITGVLVGVISSVALVIISPKVWPGPESEGGLISGYDLANPGIISIPLGFIGCWLGTVLSREREPEFVFDELRVRSETGLGAEVGTGLTLTGHASGNGNGNGARSAEERRQAVGAR
jgi:hypothetical protein